MRTIKIIITSVIIAVYMGISVYAEDIVRIGIKDNVQEAGFGKGAFEVGYDGGNKEFVKCGEISGDDIEVKILNGSFTEIGSGYDSYDKAAQICNENEYPAIVNGKWCVYSMGGDVKTTDCAVGVYDGGVLIMIANSDDDLQMKRKGNNFTEVDGVQYRGVIETYRNGEVMNIINFIDVEEYLYGVLPSEMTSSWDKEALKAQAVAARTYRMKNSGIHDQSGYDLCCTTHCQAYKGVELEDEKSTQAVDDTKGEMIYYQGELINAMYFSSSGGYTANSEDVLGSEVPYLRGVEDKYEKESKEWERKFTLSQLTQMTSGIGNVMGLLAKTDEKTGRVNEITLVGMNGDKTIKNEQIRTFFSSFGGMLESRNFTVNIGGNGGSDKYDGDEAVFVIGDGSKKSIDIGKLYLENGEKIQNGEEIKIVGSSGEIYISAGSGKEKKNEKTADESNFSPDVIILKGRGAGHGIGMSQYGAKGMAESGYDYKEILKYYYTGVEVR
ncbi:MAG: SpoIID/LytB domain-containing protein [Firmicutes bacterium]|nr:SpoIID/LytB domain-containing protein [Bacillota bacterium]